MLYSQGFRSAERLSGKVVPLFKLCKEQLSDQAHYDFGLRALKSVLVSAGNLKRRERDSLRSASDEQALASSASEEAEQDVLIRSISETLIPKLVAGDIGLLHSLVQDVFPGAKIREIDQARLRKEIQAIAVEWHLDGDAERWVEKALQLFQIQNLHHGVMMVGPSGSGKTQAWKVLLEALARIEEVKGEAYVIDPKAISKEQLYGSLDPTTREWSDGIFTHLLRKIIDNVRGESLKRHWILFDGDVDPEWVENLNSVLDDNKLLTLPNGERLALPPNVKVMFEVQDLRYATLATVSRCGMVWFSAETLRIEMVLRHYLAKLRHNPVAGADDLGFEDPTAVLRFQGVCCDAVEPFLAPGELVMRCLAYAEELEHIMDFTALRAVNTFYSLVAKGVSQVLQYNAAHPDFPLTADHISRYMQRRVAYSVLWGFGGDMRLDDRYEFSKKIAQTSTIPCPADGYIIDYEVRIDTGEWAPWSARVPQVEVEPHKVKWENWGEGKRN
jgi:dynein heavy chain 1